MGADFSRQLTLWQVCVKFDALQGLRIASAKIQGCQNLYCLHVVLENSTRLPPQSHCRTSTISPEHQDRVSDHSVTLQSLPQECAAALRLAQAISHTMRLFFDSLATSPAGDTAVATSVLWWSWSAQTVLQAVTEECKTWSSVPANASILQLSCWRALNPGVSLRTAVASFHYILGFIVLERLMVIISSQLFRSLHAIQLYVPLMTVKSAGWTGEATNDRLDLDRLMQVKIRSKAEHAIVDAVYPVVGALTRLILSLASQPAALPHIQVQQTYLAESDAD